MENIQDFQAETVTKNDKCLLLFDINSHFIQTTKRQLHQRHTYFRRFFLRYFSLDSFVD